MVKQLVFVVGRELGTFGILFLLSVLIAGLKVFQHGVYFYRYLSSCRRGREGLGFKLFNPRFLNWWRLVKMAGFIEFLVHVHIF